MDKELKSKWVAALRSGEYQQTRQRLHDDYGYCCIGVLCEVGELFGWDGKSILRDDNEERDEACLTNAQAIEVGLFNAHHEILDCTLMTMNDGMDGKVENASSFNEIADWIERNVV